MAAFDYDCPTIVAGFIQETGRYIQDVASKSIPYTPWIANTPRGEWKNELGPIQSSVVFERTVPTDTGEEWTDTVTSDGGSNAACDYDPEIVHFGQTTRSMRRQKRYFQTEDFCLEDLKDSMMIEKFLRGIGKNLTGVSKYVWATRNRREYARLAEHKVTENASMNLDDTDFDVNDPPTSRLTWGTLEQIYDFLFLNGIYDGGSIGMGASGKYIFPLISSANTIRDLIRQDPELREDFRFAFEGMGANSPLLTAYGGGGISYNGYKPVLDYPRRWDIVGGQWVERHPYGSPTATTKGYKQELDSRYRFAAYEDTVIHIPSVMRQLVERPVSNPGGDFKFSPQNYMGDFDFKVIIDKKCNPRGNKGFFDALFMSASEPGETWHGFVIRHKNCPPRRVLQTSCYEELTYEG